VVNGKLYLVEETLLATVQLIRMPELAVIGGIELSFPLSQAMRSLLQPSGLAGEGGWDPYEPDSIDQARSLSLGVSTDGHSIAPEGDEDWFLLALDDFDGTGYVSIYTTGSTDTYIEVYGPDDQSSLLTENDDSEDYNAMVNFSVQTGQRFWIKVRGFDESITGPYAIASQIEMFGEDASEPNDYMEDSGFLASDGQWLSSMIVPIGDEDWYYVDVPRSAGGEMMLVIETEGELDTFLDLFNVDGDHVAADDDGGTDANARINLILGEVTRYYVRARHYEDSGSGPYRIRAVLESVTLDRFEPDNLMEDAKQIDINGDAQNRIFVPGSPGNARIRSGSKNSIICIILHINSL